MSEPSGESKKDRVIADSGWGIKPDDQPANAADAGQHACRVYPYNPSEPDAVSRPSENRSR